MYTGQRLSLSLICGPCVSQDIAGPTCQGHNGIKFWRTVPTHSKHNNRRRPFTSHSPFYSAKFEKFNQFANHPTVEPPLQSHLVESCRAKMDSSSSTAESRAPARLRARSRAPKPALVAATASWWPETVAMAVAGPAAAEWASREAIPDVPPGFRKEDADPARMALKRKADEGFLQNPNNKKAKNNEASSDEEEEYPRRWPDFD